MENISDLIIRTLEEDLSEIEHKHDIEGHNAKTATLTVMFVIIIMVNLSLVVKQRRKITQKRKSSTPNNSRMIKMIDSESLPYTLINFGVVNIFSSVFTVLVYAILLNASNWTVGDVVCKVVRFLETMAGFLGQFSVVSVLLAFVAERGTRKSGRTVALFFTPPCWVCAACFSVPNALLHQVATNSQGRVDCRITSQPTQYGLDLATYDTLLLLNFLLLLFIWIWSFLIAITVSCVYCTMGKKQDKSTSAADRIAYSYNTASEKCTQKEDNITPLENTTNPKVKVTYVPLLIVTTSFTLWTPATVYSFLYEVYDMTVVGVFSWVYIIAWMSLIIGPVIALLEPWLSAKRIVHVNGFSFVRLTEEDAV